jgi:hypothetical protein
VEMATKTYLLELPEELHANIKATAALTKGKTMGDLMIEALKEKFAIGITLPRGGGGYEPSKVD